ncbi:MAG: tRNA (guanosine(46)-N7)-methyltransferase TrmB [Marinicellaceae bacterium]
MSKTIQHKIRSFVMRAGKLTAGQKRAIEELLPLYKLEENSLFNKLTAFENNNPVCLDVGFGNGESLIHIAQMYPEINFVGIEVHSPGVGHLLINMEKYALKNIRIYQHDGVEVLKNCFENDSIDALHIYFPDPWHKKRHNKRRLIQKPFIELITPKLVHKSRIHLATDWHEYALHIQETFAEYDAYENIEKNNDFTKKPDWRPITKFERRGQNLGHNSYDLVYHLNKNLLSKPKTNQ